MTKERGTLRLRRLRLNTWDVRVCSIWLTLWGCGLGDCGSLRWKTLRDGLRDGLRNTLGGGLWDGLGWGGLGEGLWSSLGWDRLWYGLGGGDRCLWPIRSIFGEGNSGRLRGLIRDRLLL